MKKIISMVMVLAMLFTFVNGISIVSAADATAIGGRCLLYEDFENYTAGDSVAAGNNVTVGNAVNAVVANDATLGNYLVRTAKTPEEGTPNYNLTYSFEGASKIAVDFSVKIVNTTASAFVGVYDSSKSVNAGPSFEISKGTIKGWNTANSGYTDGIVYDITNWIQMRFIADTKTQSAEVWFNGRYKGTFPFRVQSGNLLDSLRVDVRGGEYYFDNIRVLNADDTYINENFNEYTNGQMPVAGVAKDDLSKTNIVTGVFTVQNDALVINNTTSAEHRLWYSFPASEELEVEFDIKGAAAGGNIYINSYDAINSSGSHLNTGVAIFINNGKLGVYNTLAANAVNLATLSDSAYTNVKIRANTKTRTEQIWINGVLKGEYGFRANNSPVPTVLDKISIRSTAGKTFTMDNLKISKPGNYYVNEDFEEYAIGETPAAGKIMSVATVKNDAALSATTGNNGQYMVINGITETEENMIYTFPESQKIAAEFKVYNPYSDTTANSVTVVLQENNKPTTGAPLNIEQGRITRVDNNAQAQWVATPSKQKWDAFKILADVETQTFKLWLNGSLCGEYPFRNAPASLSQLRFYGKKGGLNKYFDDIKIYPVVDSVVKSVACENGQFIIDADTTVETNINTTNIYDAVTITDEYGRNIEYSFVNDVSDSKLYIKPNTDLLAGVTYILNVSGLADSNGAVFDDIMEMFTMDGVKTDIDTAKVTLKNQNGSIYIKTGDTVKACAEVLNAGKMPSYKLVLAYYDISGKLTNVEISETKTAKADEVTTSDFTGTQVIDANIASVKAFIWSDDNTISPYGKADITNTNDVSFNNGETLTVAMIGDSITAGCNYEKYIEHYYNMKYPERDIVFYNKGISRGNANKVVARFDWDILNNEYTEKPDVATMMIGMNDINHSEYPDGDTEKYLNWCYENIEAVINLCKENDIELTLITPSLYDDDAEAEGLSAAIEGVNEGLGKVADKMKEFAETYNLELIDMWTATNEINDAIRASASVTGKLLSDDRIHLNGLGDVAFAYSFIKQQLGDDAKIMVDVAADGSIVLNNARVSEFTKTEDGVSFKYSPKGLPMAVTDKYIELENYGYDITGEINSEIIKIAGLEDGEYTLKVDDAVLGTYSASKLSKGVNISGNELYAGQIKAMELFENTNQKRFYEHRTRCSAYCDELMIANNIEYTDEDVAYEWLNEKLNDSSFASHKDFISITLKDVWGKKASVWENLNNYAKAAETTPYAYTYNVTITKN